MAKTSATNSAATTAEAAPGAKGGLPQIAMRGGALALTATLLGFAWLLAWDLPNHNRQHLEQLGTEVAAQQARTVDEFVAQMQARLAGAAGSALLLERFNTPDADLQSLQAELQHAFPETVSLRAIALGPLGIAAVDTARAGLRNNIEVDMLRRVSGGATSQPEAYQVDKQWLISFVQPVGAADSKFASGALLATVPARYVQDLLARRLGERGAAVVQQKVGAQTMVIATAGSGDATDWTMSVALSVPQWELQFTPANAWLEPARQSPVPLIAALIVAVAGILGGLFMLVGAFRRALERNLVAVVANQPTDLPGFAELRQQLQRRLGAAPKPKAETEPATNTAAAPPATTTEELAQIVEELDDLPLQMPDTIFRAYDIRGIAAHQLTDEIVYQIGLAIGSEAVERGQQELVVGRDGRATSPAIIEALIRGLRDSGRNVIDVGLVPTPVLYFAAQQLGTQSGVVVTGSHNPAEYNGMKIVIGGKTLAGGAIAALKTRIQERRYSRGKGSYRIEQIDDRYIDYIVNDVAIAQPLKLVIDAGNGATSAIAPRLFEQLGCEVVPLYCEVDPTFPNHEPDPSIDANLAGLVDAVRENGADVGIAFDGDGDRVAVVTASGTILPADRLLMLLAQDVVSRNPGADVIFDVKCSRHLNNVISSYGGRPIMWKSGHSFMKEKMAETGALLGGEFSGHIFFNERWFGFDDGMYAAARLIEILSTTDPNLDAQLALLPHSISTPEYRIAIDERAKFELIEQLAAKARFGEGKLTTLDGIRVDFPDGWGLVRASNTTPALTMRFEADDEAALDRIRSLFKDQLRAIDPGLDFGF